MRWKCLVISLLFCSVATFAQYRAGIQGVVADPQGGAVSGATVTLTSIETNITKTTTTNSDGVYNFLSLAPGHYSISVEATGFKKRYLQNVAVAAEQTQAVNISLEIGEVTQTVTVTGEVAPAMDTET